MGIFSLTQELAIDLGTANTLIIYNGKVVVDEPSIVALDVHTGKLVAIGQQARQMHEKTNPNIKTIRPLKDGVIADFNATELMLRGMIKKVKTSGSLFAPSLRMVICIPSGSTNVEIRAVRDSAEHAGGREVYMIYEPMAAALGAGLGFWLALAAFAAVRSKIRERYVPKAWRGLPIYLLTAAILSMALLAF